MMMMIKMMKNMMIIEPKFKKVEKIILELELVQELMEINKEEVHHQVETRKEDLKLLKEKFKI
jgi:hypothetical protein